MKRSALRAAIGSVCLAIALVCGLVLSGCSKEPSAEELIRQDISDTLDRVKDLDDATAEELKESMDTTSLEPYGIDAEELIRSMVDGFDYTIGTVTVDEDAGAATAELTVTSKSMAELYGSIGDMISELLSGPDMLELITNEDALNQRTGELIMEAVAAIEPSEKQIELEYAKGDDGWELDGGSGAELAQIFVGDTSALANGLDETEPQADEPEANEPQANTPQTDTNAASGVTVSQQNALESAQSYLKFSHFSYTGLIDQLEYEEFSTEDATWAADNCGADWNEQALGSARDYLEFSAFSYTGLIGQLEYEGFTSEQATYAADNCGADWNEQAAKSAQSYLDFSSFSRNGLIEQLEYEGFTSEQATYGVDAVGL